MTLRTVDGGATWDPANAVNENLYGVACAQSLTCVAVGVNGAIATSRASRGSCGTVERARIWRRWPARARVCYVGGTDGVILATADGGHSWRAAQPLALRERRRRVDMNEQTLAMGPGPSLRGGFFLALTWPHT